MSLLPTSPLPALILAPSMLCPVVDAVVEVLSRASQVDKLQRALAAGLHASDASAVRIGLADGAAIEPWTAYCLAATRDPCVAVVSHDTSAKPIQNAGADGDEVAYSLGALPLRLTISDGANALEREWRMVALLLAMAISADRDRRRLEAEVQERVSELAAQRRFTERIVDSLPVGLYVVDREYRIQAWNQKRESGLQGVSRRRAIGRTIFDVLHRQPATVLKREFDEVFSSGRLQQFQMESQATGSVRTFRLSKIPMRLDDSRPLAVTHVITIGEDITDWRAAIDRIAQSEKLAALGQLATGVMHEINNPLATIAACAETLSLQAEDAAATRAESRAGSTTEKNVVTPGVPAGDPRELLQIIDLEVQRCKRIVHGLLEFARSKPVLFEPLDLNGIVRQTLFLLQHHPRTRLVSLVTELEEATSLQLHGDVDRLVQVVMALILNAIDASADGARVVVRTTRAPAAEGGACLLDVVDEGHGIPRDILGRIFEPFFSTKMHGFGTGLGLSICYGLVMEHGGWIAVDSAVAVGSTFRVVLPSEGGSPIPPDASYRTVRHESLESMK